MSAQNGPARIGPRPGLPDPAARFLQPAPKGIDYGRLAWGNKYNILACLLVGAIGGVISVTLKTPLYSATSTVELVDYRPGFTGTNQSGPQPGAPLPAAATQVRILTSHALLSRVFERMNLELTPATSAPATVFTKLRERIPYLQSEPMLQSREALSTAISTVSARQLGATGLIEISCLSTSPEIAASFVNTLAAEDDSQIVAARANANQRSSQWMESQMEEARARLQDANEKLRDFVQKSGMDFFPAQSTLADSKLHTLQQDAAGIQAERIAKQARWELARSTPLDNLPEVMNEPQLLLLKRQIAGFRWDLSQLSQTLTPEHAKVKKLQAQIAEAEQTLEKEESTLLKQTQVAYDEALRQEKLLVGAYNAQTRTVSGQADKEAQYTMLTRNVDMQQQLYNTLLQQSNTAALVALAPSSGVRVIDPATPNPAPSSPSPQKDIPAWSMAGGALGYGLLLLRAMALRRKGANLFDAPGHTGALLGVPELGVIPTAEFSRQSKRRLSLKGSNGSPAQSLVLGIDEPGNAGGAWPGGEILSPGASSLLSESFRQTLVSLVRAKPLNHNPAYVITSAGPGEGKTMLSAHLARAMAEVGQRVLLLDADLRKPHLHHHLGVEDHEGLSDLLAGSSDLAKFDPARYIQSTPFPNLSVMTHGRLAIDSPGVLFFSPRVGELIVRLKTQYDCILFDTAPSLLFPDARLWGRYSDGIVLVVRAGVTTREGASAACERFLSDGIPVLGTILNDWTPDPQSGAYYYGQYYSRARSGKS